MNTISVPRGHSRVILARGSSCAHVSDSRVTSALEEYLTAIEAGDPLAKEELLARFADVANELRDCLDSLDFMHQVAPQLGADASAAERMGNPAGTELKTLGDFRILREIGRGGMGVVYEAEQLSLGRRVALKVLPFAAMLSDVQRKRFQNEARAAATLDHPNIVNVYSVGVERSIHYYAMQLVEGHNLAQIVEEFQADQLPCVGDGSTRNDVERGSDTAFALSTLRSHRPQEFFRAVARLGIQAAEALDHAHQQGIVHRDVKPANLLVDSAGKLWVADFGLARLEADAGMTMTGDLVGTLRYMSPEQALAKRKVVDHRSDVYSLGATLYELLALRPMFEEANRVELLKHIASIEPPELRRLDAAIPAELETIIVKATAKDPSQRYVTAGALADDLLRYIDHRPIQARRATIGEKCVKWLSRHAYIVRWASAVLLLATIGSILSAVLIEKERGVALRQLAETNKHRERADINFGAALHVVESLIARLNASSIGTTPEVRELREHSALRVRTFLEEFVIENSSDFSERLQSGAAYVHLGRLSISMGDSATGQDYYLRGANSFRTLASDYPSDPRPIGNLATCESIHGCHLYAIGDHSNATRHFAAARSAARRWLRVAPKEWRSSDAVPVFTFLRIFERDDLERLSSPLFDYFDTMDIARKSCYLGILEYRRGNWQNAVDSLRIAVNQGEIAHCWILTDGARVVLAISLFQLGHKSEAFAQYDRALAEDQSVRQEFEDNSLFYAEAAHLLKRP